MKFYVCAVVMISLAACSGGGGGGGDDGGDGGTPVDLTPDAPDATLNSDFGMLMNGSRSASKPDLVYNDTVGKVAQAQANVMFEDGHLSEWESGTAGVGRDVGDRLNDEGYSWFSYAARTEQGENTVADQMTEFEDDICQGSAITCFEVTEFEEFGIARAGAGDDTKWMLILTEPNNP